jgi:hypothetical protein
VPLGSHLVHLFRVRHHAHSEPGLRQAVLEVEPVRAQAADLHRPLQVGVHRGLNYGEAVG